jgi:RNA polymerase sigma factor (sigma-70 family)
MPCISILRLGGCLTMRTRKISEKEQIELIEKHLKLTRFLIRKWKRIFYELEQTEIESASYYALFKATINYNPTKGIKFSSYVFKCIKNQVLQLAKKKGLPMLSLDLDLSSDKDETINLYDLIVTASPIEVIENKMYIEYLLSFCNEQEKKYLIEYYMNKEKQSELAKEDGYCYQNIARVIAQAKRRIRKNALH